MARIDGPREIVQRALLAAAAALAAGCVTYDGKRAVVPFFEIADGPARAAGASKAPAEAVEGATSREFVLRPFGSFERIEAPAAAAATGDEVAERARVKLFWPLIDVAWGEGNARAWLLPVFYFRLKPRPEGHSDLDWFLLPFFGGSDPEEGRYFAVFPLGGRLLGLVAKKEIHFALVPLYWRSWDGDYDSMHILFPIFNRVRGGGHRGWRVWPFYGAYAADRAATGAPRYRRRFILWPFFIAGEENLDSQRPTRNLLVFPFYGQSLNPHTETRVYLWPFFHSARDVESGHKLYFGYVLPYRFTGGQFDLWPLFGWKTRAYGDRLGDRDPRGIAGPGGRFGLDRDHAQGELPPTGINTRFRQFALFPIQRYDRDQGDTWDSTKLWVLPFFWHFHTLDKDSFEVADEWKLWPLFRYRRVGEWSSFYFPSPLWFRQENLFERLYARLWRLFLYQRSPERSGWEFLYGLLSYRHERDDDDERVYSIFYGLFEVSSGADGLGMRVLYLPWR